MNWWLQHGVTFTGDMLLEHHPGVGALPHQYIDLYLGLLHSSNPIMPHLQLWASSDLVSHEMKQQVSNLIELQKNIKEQHVNNDYNFPVLSMLVFFGNKLLLSVLGSIVVLVS